MSAVATSHPSPSTDAQAAVAEQQRRNVEELIGRVLTLGDDMARLKAAAEPLAKCTAGWGGYGYPPPSLYTCLDREQHIADPDHPTRDWWPHNGPCLGCELRRAMGGT